MQFLATLAVALVQEPGFAGLEPAWGFYEHTAAATRYEVFPYVGGTLLSTADSTGQVAVTFEARGSGAVTHFYHFLVNAALPLFAAVAGMTPADQARLQIHVPDVGGVFGLLWAIFPGLNLIRDPSVPCKTASTASDVWGVPGAYTPKRLLVLGSFSTERYASEAHGSTLRPVYTDVVRSFAAYVKQSQRVVDGPANDVLFVARGTNDEMVGGMCTGACRRRLANEPDVAAALAAWADRRQQPFALRRFEQVPFAEQVSAAAAADVLIGQHGAGLAHCLWMQPTAAVVQIKGFETPAHDSFSNLCGDLRGLRVENFHVLVPPKSVLTVPVPEFVNWLDAVEAERRADPAPRALLARRAAPAKSSPLWTELDEVLRPFKPLAEGYATQSSRQTEQYAALAAAPAVRTICETGFNGGHSALLYLLANPTAHVISFDLGKYAYTDAAAQWLAAKFPQRFELIRGDSTQTVPRLVAERPDLRCDFISVDGGHTEEVATADVWNLARIATLSPSGDAANVLLVDDTPCMAPYCAGPKRAWSAAVSYAVVEPIEQVRVNPRRGYSLGTVIARPQ